MKSLEHKIMQEDWTKEIFKVLKNWNKQYEMTINDNNIKIGNQNHPMGFVSITVKYIMSKECNIGIKNSLHQHNKRNEM